MAPRPVVRRRGAILPAGGIRSSRRSRCSRSVLTGRCPGRQRRCRDAIGAALCRTGWVRIVTAPAGRYHLRCNVRDDGSGTLRIRLMLIDHSLSRYVWADCFECIPGDLSGCQEWLPNLVSGVLRAVLYNAEIARTAGDDRARLNRMGPQHARPADGARGRPGSAHNRSRIARPGNGTRSARSRADGALSVVSRPARRSPFYRASWARA